MAGCCGIWAFVGYIVVDLGSSVTSWALSELRGKVDLTVGYPHPMVDSPSCLFLLRMGGPTGLDVVLGTASYLFSQVAGKMIPFDTLLPTASFAHLF